MDQLLGLSGTEGKVPRSSSDGLSSQPNRRPDRRVASHKAGQAQDGQNGHDAESQQTLLYEALYMDAEDDADGPSSPSSAAPSQVQRANGVTRQDPARGQASLSPGDLSATWANLQRVRQDYRVVLEQGPSSFVTLLDSKLQRISETLQKQAETLMRTLLSTERDGGSLLFAAERDEARRETVLGRGKSSAQDLEASKEEQESWLRLSMEILGSAKSGGEQGRSRALEVLSDALISPALKKVGKLQNTPIRIADVFPYRQSPIPRSTLQLTVSALHPQRRSLPSKARSSPPFTIRSSRSSKTTFQKFCASPHLQAHRLHDMCSARWSMQTVCKHSWNS